MASDAVTLTQHILVQQKKHPHATGQLSALLTQIGVAGKLIQAQVRRAGLIEVWGATGETNVQGETVQKLDRIAQDILIEVLSRSGCVAAMASEEEHDVIEVPPDRAGDYVVMFDPLDGSSNIDANVTIGTIFGVFQRCSKEEVVRRDTMRSGRQQIAAGYILYGSSTVFVYTTGQSVDCFTLDPAAGEYFLTRGELQMPQRARVLSINECNAPYWPDWVAPYISAIKGRNDNDKRRVTSRHIGSLVADFHRNLIYGGVFLYPLDKRTNRGKLRLLYECNPLAFIAETAGGRASWGGGPILDMEPQALHDRTAFIVGPAADVAECEAMVAKHSQG